MYLPEGVGDKQKILIVKKWNVWREHRVYCTVCQYVIKIKYYVSHIIDDIINNYWTKILLEYN